MADETKPRRFFTKRLLFSLLFFGTSTAALFDGKMSDSAYVYAMAVIIAGHNAVEVIKVWKGGA